MSPKEKAQELYCKYADALNVRDMRITANPYVKQCALISVNEILGQFKWRPKDSLSYWEEVKLELEKL
jgi:hypothetical protein